MSYRPRGTLAKTLYDKMRNDQYIEGYDMKQWYTLPTLLSEKYQKKYIKFDEPDEFTLEWLDDAKSLSGSLWLQIWHVIARMFLGFFMTQTSINGLLKRGSMFILSEAQFNHLLVSGGFDGSPNVHPNRDISILDVGAGDGEVTIRLVKAVNKLRPNISIKTFATEYSWTMRDRLEEKNFIVIDRIDEVQNIDLISCLNVLDRCANPHQLMHEIYRSLAPNGRVVVALVLPYCHYVETNTSHLPIKPLLPHWPTECNLSFDVEASSFFEQIELMGFNIEAWTRAPYLCQGDLRQSYYWLVDVVAVLSKKSQITN